MREKKRVLDLIHSHDSITRNMAKLKGEMWRKRKINIIKLLRKDRKKIHQANSRSMTHLRATDKI